MYVKLEPFGYNVYGESIGSTWLSLVEVVLKNGVMTEDEGRKRLSLQNIRIKSTTQQFPDILLEKYGNKYSLTWTRIMNVLMCQILNDWSFQFISLPIEIEFGNYYDKDVYIRFMVENSIPIEKTRTCATASKIPCGDCPPCLDTRRILNELGIKDKRRYLFPMSKNFPTYYTHEKELTNLLHSYEKGNRS